MMLHVLASYYLTAGGGGVKSKREIVFNYRVSQ